MNLKKLLRSEGTIFLDSGFRGVPLLFSGPEKIITAASPGEIKPAFTELQQAVNGGYYCPGFISYEAGRVLMDMPVRETGFPYLWFGVYSSPEKLYPDVIDSPTAPPEIQPVAELEQEQYREGFEKIKNYIRAGDTYQVNYTFQIEFEPDISLAELFLRLRRHHPVPYSAFIQTREFTVSSHSPELFLRCEGDELQARPMKGTAPRGKTVIEDNARRESLHNSRKERAENLMIVDLLRNDLGKVGQTGTVEVPRLFEVEQYESVHQMVSTVKTKINTDSIYEIFKALFPCGSITGAPKRRTMEIIREVETSPREIYTGSIGLFLPTGDFSFNIAIRTLSSSKNSSKVRMGTGGGVVIDGKAEEEWEEAWLKTEFLSCRKPEFSLVETIRYTPAEGLPLLARHLERLERSADYFSIPMERKKIREQLVERLSRHSRSVKVRLLMDFAGRMNLEVSELPRAPYPLRVGLARRELNPREISHLRHKTTFRPTYSELRSRAEENGYFDYLLVDRDGHLTEGTISNIFVEIDGNLYTPPVERGLLPGVMRSRLLENGAEEKNISREELFEADNIYLTNALRGKMAVDHLEIPGEEKVITFQ